MQNSERSAQGSALHNVLAPYVLVARAPQLRLLFAGQVVTVFGAMLYEVGVIVLVYNISHSATMVGLITVAHFLPNAAFLPFSGMLADTWDRRKLMIAAQACRGTCVLGLLFVTSSATLPLAFVLVAVGSSMETLFQPALKAVLPAVVEERDLVTINTLMGQIDSLAMVAGPALGGVFILLHAVGLIFVVTGATALLSAVSLVFTRIPSHQERTRQVEVGNWLLGVSEGFRFLFARNRGVLGGYTMAIAGVTLLDGAFWTLIVVLPRDFHLGEDGTGFLNAMYGIGGIAGAVAVSLVAGRTSASRLFIGVTAFSSICAVLWGLSPPGVTPFVTLALMGVADVILMIAGTTVIQSATPDELMGRTFAAFDSIRIGAMVAGSAIVGPVISAFGARAATVIYGLVGLFVLSLNIRKVHMTEVELGLRIFLRRVPLLSSLPLRLLDNLALLLTPGHYATGSILVKQGEPGDCMFFLREGMVDVLARSAEGFRSRSAPWEPWTSLEKSPWCGGYHARQL